MDRSSYASRSSRRPTMITTHNLGFPRIGAKRELKFGLERYWKGESSRDELKEMYNVLKATGNTQPVISAIVSLPSVEVNQPVSPTCPPESP